MSRTLRYVNIFDVETYIDGVSLPDTIDIIVENIKINDGISCGGGKIYSYRPVEENKSLLSMLKFIKFSYDDIDNIATGEVTLAEIMGIIQIDDELFLTSYIKSGARIGKHL
uniref:hypothetical protein n=1 Tax=Sphingomonas bacterium TaxID=1895847 RepID=UPI0026264163|nr:hypothetical protein [Sphingomonas bacterium]